MMKTPLDKKTPRWFEDWHIKHFSPVSDRTKRNEKWIYLIITTIIASGLLANGNGDDIVGFLKGIITAIGG